MIHIRTSSPKFEIPPAAIFSGGLIVPSSPRRDLENSDKFLSLSYAADRIGMSVSWLYKHHHELPFIVHIGGRLKVSKKKLREWMQQQKGGAS
jgi:predicted DNA-binding transcriptional regulator AlpA